MRDEISGQNEATTAPHLNPGIPSSMTDSQTIQLRGVRVNNLRDVDLDIPHGQWLSICGVSGSGKSSLAFDTLYAEGQRRYVESLSAGARRFMESLSRPDADAIDGLPPAVAVQTPKSIGSATRTLAAACEIDRYLRLLFANVASAICPQCGSSIESDDPWSVAKKLEPLAGGTRMMIAWPVPGDADHQQILAAAAKEGFLRGIHGGETFELARPPAIADSESMWLVSDRLVAGRTTVDRLTETLETTWHFGRGRAAVFVDDPQTDGTLIEIDGRPWRRREFASEHICGSCRYVIPAPEPRLFDPRSGLAVCKSCDVKLASCDACGSSGLAPEALAWRIDGNHVGEIAALPVRAAAQFLACETIASAAACSSPTRRIVDQLRRRIDFLSGVGLDYLTLNRPLSTLSSGEAQRTTLTSVLSSTLVNMLYVLDEPTFGLHRHDVEKLIAAIKQLHDRGNTLVVVDHEETMIRAAQRVVEMGPAAGSAGGEQVFDGSVEQLVASEESLTGDFLAGRRGQTGSAENRRDVRRKIRLTGASGHNLNNVNATFPLGVLCCVTGVSGSGKSSLVIDTLLPELKRQMGEAGDDPLPFKQLTGADGLHEVVFADASPLGRSSRSNPVTYVNAFTDMRKVFAETHDAKMHSVPAGDFSFNVRGGRCEKCQGEGVLTVDMQFLPDMRITCDDCGGTRYREHVLAVRYRDKNISQVLAMTVRDAFAFFRGQPKVQSRLKSLIDVGLEYVQLGQPAATLSSGEARRLKLAHYLGTAKSKRILFIMDEPTAGLHMADVTRLVDCFDNLIAVGHSMIVIEHNLQFIRHADWVIDLGPGGGDDGGRVIAEGTPEQVAETAGSATGQYLKTMLG